MFAEYLYHRYGLLGSAIRFLYAVGPLPNSQRGYGHRQSGLNNANEWCSCCRSKKIYPTRLTSDDASENGNADRLEYFVRHKSIPMFGRFLSKSKVNSCDSRIVNPGHHNTDIDVRGFNVLSLEPYSMVCDKDTEETQVVLDSSDVSNNSNRIHGLTVEGGEESFIAAQPSIDNTGTPSQAETDSLLASSSSSNF
jgi:hypothetical protein